MKHFKKILTILFALLMTLTTVIDSFCVGINDSSQYVTKEEFNNRVSKVKNSIKSIKNNYSNDLNTQIKNFFDPVINEPVVGSVGIGVDKDSTNNKWQISSTGAEYTILEGTYTKNQLIRLVDNSYSTNLYVCTKIAASDSPFRDPSSTAATGSVYTGLIEIFKDSVDGDDYYIDAYNPESGRKYRAKTFDGGTNWTAWEIFNSNVPWGTCATAAGTAAKEVKFKYDQYDGNQSWGKGFIVKFTNKSGTALGTNITLKLNNGPARYLYYKNAQLEGPGAWSAGTIMFIRFHAEDKFRITFKNKTGLVLLGEATAATSTTTKTWTKKNYYTAFYIEHKFPHGSSPTRETRYNTQIISAPLLGDGDSTSEWILTSTWPGYSTGTPTTATDTYYAQVCFGLSTSKAHIYMNSSSTGSSWGFGYVRVYGVV